MPARLNTSQHLNVTLHSEPSDRCSSSRAARTTEEISAAFEDVQQRLKEWKEEMREANAKRMMNSRSATQPNRREVTESASTTTDCLNHPRRANSGAHHAPIKNAVSALDDYRRQINAVSMETGHTSRYRRESEVDPRDVNFYGARSIVRDYIRRPLQMERKRNVNPVEEKTSTKPIHGTGSLHSVPLNRSAILRRESVCRTYSTSNGRRAAPSYLSHPPTSQKFEYSRPRTTSAASRNSDPSIRSDRGFTASVFALGPPHRASPPLRKHGVGNAESSRLSEPGRWAATTGFSHFKPPVQVDVANNNAFPWSARRPSRNCGAAHHPPAQSAEASRDWRCTSSSGRHSYTTSPTKAKAAADVGVSPPRPPATVSDIFVSNTHINSWKSPVRKDRISATIHWSEPTQSFSKPQIVHDLSASLADNSKEQSPTPRTFLPRQRPQRHWEDSCLSTVPGAATRNWRDALRDL